MTCEVITHCRRCGDEKDASARWWCDECLPAVAVLMERGQSMVQIAAGGEFDPPRFDLPPSIVDDLGVQRFSLTADPRVIGPMNRRSDKPIRRRRMTHWHVSTQS